MTGPEPRHINPNEAGTESREAQSAWIGGGRAQPILSASMPVTKTLSTPAMSPTMNSAPTMIAVLLYHGAASAAGAFAPGVLQLRGFPLVITASTVPSHFSARGALPAPRAWSSSWEEAMRQRRCRRRPGGVNQVVRRGHLCRPPNPREGRGGLPRKWTMLTLRRHGLFVTCRGDVPRMAGFPALSRLALARSQGQHPEVRT